MKRPLTDHEYQINGGAWIDCTTANSTNHGDGTYTIHNGLNVAIPIGGLKVRVKSLGINPESSALLNTVAFSTPAIRNYQIIFRGDSLTCGIGTTGTGTSATGVYFGPNSYPVKTISKLTGIDVTPFYGGYPGETAIFGASHDQATTVSIVDRENYTDTYCIVFWGANDLVLDTDVAFRTALADYCTPIKAAGVKVIIVPVLSRKDSYAASVSYINITRRNNFNTWLNANYSNFADAVVDLSGSPEIFADDAPDNGTYFARPDTDGLYGVHLADAGADMLAIAVASTITTLNATAPIPFVPVDYAANFIAAAGITDSTQISAINTFVSSMVAAKLWHKIPVIYPYVGGTPVAHKLNLRNPLDTDAAYRQLFNGVPTHDANGVTWVSGSYADTNYKHSIALFIGENASLHYYSRTATPASEGIDIGLYALRTNWLGIKLGSNSYSSVSDSDGGGTPETYTATGLFTVSRNSPTQRSLYKNGVLVRDTLSAVGFPVANNLYIGAANNAGSPNYPSSRNCAYAAIGLGLTADEEAAHYTIVQAFQTALGRAV